MRKKSNVVIKEVGKDPYIKEIKRKKLDIYEAKEIASKLIGCELVDGLNLYYEDNNYASGVYCDDLAMYRYPYNCTINGNKGYGTIVLINENNLTDIEEAQRILNRFMEVIKHG